MINFQQYWTQPSLDKNKALVDYLKQYGAVRTDKVAEVMETIDRALFVPEGTPYIDSPMPIGFNATISAPHMHATCLEVGTTEGSFAARHACSGCRVRCVANTLFIRNYS